MADGAIGVSPQISRRVWPPPWPSWIDAFEIDRGAGEPGGPAREDENHEISDVLHLAEAYDPGFSAQALADFYFRLSCAFDLGANAAPLPLGLHQARMNAIDANPVLL